MLVGNFTCFHQSFKIMSFPPDNTSIFRAMSTRTQHNRNQVGADRRVFLLMFMLLFLLLLWKCVCNGRENAKSVSENEKNDKTKGTMKL